METLIIDLHPLYNQISQLLIDFLVNKSEEDFYVVREGLTYNDSQPSLLMDTLVEQLVALILYKDIDIQHMYSKILGTVFSLYGNDIEIKVTSNDIPRILFEHAYLFFKEVIDKIGNSFITSSEIINQDLFVSYDLNLLPDRYYDE